MVSAPPSSATSDERADSAVLTVFSKLGSDKAVRRRANLRDPAAGTRTLGDTSLMFTMKRLGLTDDDFKPSQITVDYMHNIVGETTTVGSPPALLKTSSGRLIDVFLQMIMSNMLEMQHEELMRLQTNLVTTGTGMISPRRTPTSVSGGHRGGRGGIMSVTIPADSNSASSALGDGSELVPHSPRVAPAAPAKPTKAQAIAKLEKAISVFNSLIARVESGDTAEMAFVIKQMLEVGVAALEPDFEDIYVPKPSSRTSVLLTLGAHTIALYFGLIYGMVSEDKAAPVLTMDVADVFSVGSAFSNYAQMVTVVADFRRSMRENFVNFINLFAPLFNLLNGRGHLTPRVQCVLLCVSQVMMGIAAVGLAGTSIGTGASLGSAAHKAVLDLSGSEDFAQAAKYTMWPLRSLLIYKSALGVFSFLTLLLRKFWNTLQELNNGDATLTSTLLLRLSLPLLAAACGIIYSLAQEETIREFVNQEFTHSNSTTVPEGFIGASVATGVPLNLIFDAQGAYTLIDAVSRPHSALIAVVALALTTGFPGAALVSGGYLGLSILFVAVVAYIAAALSNAFSLASHPLIASIVVHARRERDLRAVSAGLDDVQLETTAMLLRETSTAVASNPIPVASVAGSDDSTANTPLLRAGASADRVGVPVAESPSLQEGSRVITEVNRLLQVPLGDARRALGTDEVPLEKVRATLAGADRTVYLALKSAVTTVFASITGCCSRRGRPTASRLDSDDLGMTASAPGGGGGSG